MTMPGKGILAMDESNATCGSRLEGVGVENIEENRRRYRELLITTPDLGEHIGGAILFEETLYQSCADGTSFVDALKAQGIDEIVVYCVNDAAVMEAWSDKMNVKPKSLVTMLADPGCKFTEAMGLAMPADEVPPQLGYVRSKRFAAVFDDGKCTNLFVSAAPGDPAGDDDPSASLVENVLKSL